MIILNPSRFKVEPHSKYWYFGIEHWDLLLQRFSENAVLFHIEWVCRKTAGNVNRPPYCYTAVTHWACPPLSATHIIEFTAPWTTFIHTYHMLTSRTIQTDPHWMYTAKVQHISLTFKLLLHWWSLSIIHILCFTLLQWFKDPLSNGPNWIWTTSSTHTFGDYPCNISLGLDQLVQLKPSLTKPQNFYLQPFTLHNSELPSGSELLIY